MSEYEEVNIFDTPTPVLTKYENVIQAIVHTSAGHVRPGGTISIPEDEYENLHRGRLAPCRPD